MLSSGAIAGFTRKVVGLLESPKVPFRWHLLVFFAAILARCFLETQLAVYKNTDVIFDAAIVIHWMLSYVALAAWLVLLFKLLSGQPAEKVARAVLPFFILLILAPAADLLLTGGSGYRIEYIFPEDSAGLLPRFVSFFGTFSGVGVTPGMRLEIALAVLLSFAYFMVKKLGVPKSFLGAFLAYSLIFAYIALPAIAHLALGVRLGDTVDFISAYLLIAFPALAYLAYSSSKLFRLALFGIRSERLLNFWLMLAAGIAIAVKIAGAQLAPDFPAKLLLILIGTLFAWMHAVMINDIEDRVADKASGRKGLPLNKAGLGAYRSLGWLALLLSAIYSLAAGVVALAIAILFCAIYYAYSVPPLRLKRVLLLSKFLVAFNCLLMVALGYWLAAESIGGFPWQLCPLFLVGFALAANFIDIKDYEGDKKTGIATLPVALGLENAKLAIGASFFLAYLLAAWAIVGIVPAAGGLAPAVFLAAFALGEVEFWLVNRKAYDERPVMAVYLASVALALAFLILA